MAQPVLSQINTALEKRLENKRDYAAEDVHSNVKWLLSSFTSMRFLDLSPDAMRLPSFPGQVILGDRGENLSTVLQAICEDPAKKRALTEWLRELTPMDAADFEFPTDLTGRTLFDSRQKNGQRVRWHITFPGDDRRPTWARTGQILLL